VVPSEETAMLFISHYKIRPGCRDAAIERFAKTGGQPPQGIKLLGRWHAVASGSGFTISEATDASKMAGWALDWSDLMEFDVQPALDDQQLAAVLTARATK
jgi:hypothetical protein